MTEIPLTDFKGLDLPSTFFVRVLMRPGRQPEKPWMSRSWQVMGVVGDNDSAPVDGVRLSTEGEDGVQVYGGLQVRLHPDEAESYYHNITATHPRCFVITREDAQGRQVPFLVTLCFDEANAYVEGDEQVHDVALAPELYRWLEAYVLRHYLPEQRKKRKRNNWKTS